MTHSEGGDPIALVLQMMSSGKRARGRILGCR
jgi:hypothetical protein